MCLAVPVKVEELLENGMMRCRVGEGDTFVTASDALLEGPPEVGQYVIIHAGFALRVVETREAEETLRILREISAMTGPGEGGLELSGMDVRGYEKGGAAECGPDEGGAAECGPDDGGPGGLGLNRSE